MVKGKKRIKVKVVKYKKKKRAKKNIVIARANSIVVENKRLVPIIL